MNFTTEQQNIIQWAQEGYNVRVIARAGTGKTTTAMGIIQAIQEQSPTTRCLLLTYNKGLKEDGRTRITNAGLLAEAHSYHSFALKHFETNAFTDDGIRDVINGTNIRQTYAFHVWILDELQDLTPMLMQALKIFLQHNGVSRPQFITMGDDRQMIYEFRNADARFLLLSHQILGAGDGRQWKYGTLSHTFRIPQPIVSALQNVFRGMPEFHSDKLGVRPRYVIRKVYDRSVVYEVIRFLTMGYHPEDIFILAPSVRTEKSPVRCLAKNLQRVRPDIYLYVSVNDEEEFADADVLRGKLIISTFNSVKGLERKVIILFNIDASYEMYYNGKQPCPSTPNRVYVATTRALEHLTIIHDSSFDHAPFIDKEQLVQYFDFEIVNPIELEVSKSIPPKPVSVTDFLRYLSPDAIDACLCEMTIVKMASICKKIDLSKKSEQYNNMFEEVASIHGIAIPTFYEFQKFGTISLFSDSKLLDTLKKSEDPHIIFWRRIIRYWCDRCGYDFKNHQITKLNFINKKLVDALINRLDDFLTTECNGSVSGLTFEKSVESSFTDGPAIYGSIDAWHMSLNYLFEFKMVDALTSEHAIQAALYQCLIETKPAKTFLYNILTGEYWHIIVPDRAKFMSVLRQFRNKPYYVHNARFLQKWII